MKETIVVIGANHAGTAALNTILDNYKDKEVIAFDSNRYRDRRDCFTRIRRRLRQRAPKYTWKLR